MALLISTVELEIVPMYIPSVDSELCFAACRRGRAYDSELNLYVYVFDIIENGCKEDKDQ